ncbi:MAG TPA: GvpL/GvpF family gas vesicle protein [Bacillota bacterium]|nr:GvpL/GvpF family gas vesicle protein [Bacillota bacterium]
MNIRALSYLLLLMDSMGLEVETENVNRLWRQIAPNLPLEEDVLEPLVNLWQILKGSGRTVETRAAFQRPYAPPDFFQKIQDQVPEEKPVITTPEKTREKSLKPETSLVQHSLSGLYIYGIILGDNSKPILFNPSGLDYQSVRIIWYRNIGAMVHDCPPEAYQSADREIVATWLRQHQEVLDKALARFPSVIPMSFDIIFKATSELDAEQVVVGWLESNYLKVMELLNNLVGKVEFGIKVVCSNDVLTQRAENANPAIQRLKKRMASMSTGTAYLYRAELESMIRKARSEVKQVMLENLCQCLKQVVCATKEHKVSKMWKSDGEEEILNLAVLVNPQATDSLGVLLEEYQNRMGVRVHFTGPWPTYSFVQDMEVADDVAGS